MQGNSIPAECSAYPTHAFRYLHTCLPYFSLNSDTNEFLLDLLTSKVTAAHRNPLVANSMLHLT
jgi:hypothetical protein